jgi:Flp pilus assembly protein TadG
MPPSVPDESPSDAARATPGAAAPAPVSPRRHGKRARAEEGSVAVEFAATASLLLLLLFGIVVYRVHFVARAAITQAASEGARAAVVGLSTEERSALAMAAATATLSRYSAFVGQALTSVRTATETVDGAQRLAVTVCRWTCRPLGSTESPPSCRSPRRRPR